MLTFQKYGEQNDQTLLIVHGLYGSGRNWRAIAKRLSADFNAITVDMRNHAGSFWSDDMSYADMADDLSKVIEAEAGTAIVLGHSMGGKASMSLALQNPELVSKLIVADIAPVAYNHSQTQHIDAMEAVDLSKVSKRSDADAQLAETIDDPALRAFFLQSLELEGDGAKWMLNHKALREAMPSIIGWHEIPGSFEKPTLFVSGAQSDYVNTEHRPKIKALFPKARFASLKNAGHWLHAEQPKAFIQTVQAFCRA